VSLPRKGSHRPRTSARRPKAITEETADVAKDTYVTEAEGTTNYNLEIVEIARSNTNAAFDYANGLLGVKSLSELVELSSADARKQFKTLTDRSKELAALAQLLITETSEPLKAGVAKAFRRE
jgi:hypothetical protein